jgi:CheY-like chemotaxis protein
MNFSPNNSPRVLLIDCNSLKRQVRASVLRSYEVEVHTADSIAEAGSFWTRCSYDLVLLAAQQYSQEAAHLCDELRKSKPRQRIALLVGAPHYICEISRKRPEQTDQVVSILTQPKATPNSTPRSQWQGTIERLLVAAG